jgi:DnaJ-class molecular chaperone
MTSRQRDFYQILQVDPSADPEVVRAAYRVLARRLHPDRDASGMDEHRMAELNRAYETLRDADRRRAYDDERKLRPAAVGPGDRPEPDQRTGGLAARMAASSPPAMSTEGGTRLDFGRYTGMTLREVAARDGDYLRWLSRHSAGIRFRDEIAAILGEGRGRR